MTPETVQTVCVALHIVTITLLVIVIILGVMNWVARLKLLDINSKILARNIQLAETSQNILKTSEMYLSSTVRTQKETTREVKDVVKEAVQQAAVVATATAANAAVEAAVQQAGLSAATAATATEAVQAAGLETK